MNSLTAYPSQNTSNEPTRGGETIKDSQIWDNGTRTNNLNSIVYAIVENKRGVLHRVSTMFRAKGFNIMSIAIGGTIDPDLARMTIVPSGDEASLNLLVKQLRKMIDVIEVGTMTRDKSIPRELALFKFQMPNSETTKRTVADLSNSAGAKEVASTSRSFVLELCSTPEEIDSFVAKISKLAELKEVVRTGVIALQRDDP